MVTLFSLLLEACVKIPCPDPSHWSLKVRNLDSTLNLDFGLPKGEKTVLTKFNSIKDRKVTSKGAFGIF